MVIYENLLPPAAARFDVLSLLFLNAGIGRLLSAKRDGLHRSSQSERAHGAWLHRSGQAQHGDPSRMRQFPNR